MAYGRSGRPTTPPPPPPGEVVTAGDLVLDRFEVPVRLRGSGRWPRAAPGKVTRYPTGGVPSGWLPTRPRGLPADDPRVVAKQERRALERDLDVGAARERRDLADDLDRRRRHAIAELGARSAAARAANARRVTAAARDWLRQAKEGGR